MGGVGTWSWAEQTGGSLRRRDRLELLRQGILARLERMPLQLRARIVGESGPLELPDPPDTALARLAEERVRELSPPVLHGHCMRTWAFAALFAQRGRVAHDPEVLYLACVLHDLGLTAAHDGCDPGASCFAVEGARAAGSLIRAHGGDEDRALSVAGAISLHLNVTVPERLGVEAALLSRGVSLDTIGRRLYALPAAATGAVDARWPRDGLAEFLIATTGAQAQARPASRAAFLHSVGFAGLVRANPLGRHGS